MFIALVLLWIAVLPVQAAVELRFDPLDQIIPVGGLASLSVILDEALDVRTVEVWAEFNEETLLSLGGTPGTLFTGTGCQLFTDFVDDTTPGQWYGASVIIGNNCWLTGPGQLYRWDFEGIAPGFSTVTALEVRLYDPAANLIEAVSLQPTHVFVGTGTGLPPIPETRLSLDLNPNPFNPETRVQFSGPAGAARLAVYDLAGKEIGEIWSGALDGERPLAATWDGRDAAGAMQASGVYLLRLESAGGEIATRRAVLIK